jgi:hypothetical protein
MTTRKAARAPTSPLAKKKPAPKKAAAHAPPPADVIAAAQKAQAETGVPASVTLGQWAVESGYGAHAPGNNAFGIKAKPGEPSQLLWTHEKAAHGSGLVRVQQSFRKYDSMEQAFEAHGQLLAQHYPLSMAHTNDPYAFVAGLEADPHHSYATDPNYVSTVDKAIKDNNYTQYDTSGPAAVHLKDGEPSVMLGTKQQMAAHVESPHTGGGQIAQGSSSVFVGPNQLPFARFGDPTNDDLFVKTDVQDDVFIGGGQASSGNGPTSVPSATAPYFTTLNAPFQPR